MSIDSRLYQQQLLTLLRQRYPTLSARVLGAFEAVPRHLFLDHIYGYQAEGRTWTCSEQAETAVWYEQVYSDEALITRMDTSGRILSSSSQPGIMGAMLDALDLQPGMRVLEIGTGSGYNASLLAYLTGDPALVTTVDVSEEIAARARQVIPQVVGDGVTIIRADGREGYRENAPYDRVIVTASAPVVAPAWREQLSPEGKLICILQPPLAPLGGLLSTTKHDEKLQGRLIQTATFMVLHDAEYRQPDIRIDFHASLWTSMPLLASYLHPGVWRDNSACAFFLHYDLQDLALFWKEKACFLYRNAAPQGYLVFRQEPAPSLEFYGDGSVATSLWTSLVRAVLSWEGLGQPAITDYAFAMDHAAQLLSLETELGTVWPFAATHTECYP